VVQVNPAPAAAPTAPAPVADSTSGMKGMYDAAGTVGDIVAHSSGEDNTMKQIVGGIKTVANLYMGNYAGAAKSASEMAG
jgi:hypothetical protein